MKRQTKLLATWVATCALLASPCLPAQAGLLKPDVNYSNYNVPLYEQIVNRIKAKGAPRLAEGKNTRDRYFIVPFAYQRRWNNPEFSHSFISVIHLLPAGKKLGLRPGFRRGKFKGRDFEAFTISWVPHDFDRNPHLCVFDGFGSRLFASLNKCPISVGRDFTLAETLKLAVNEKNAVGMWGPYEIKKAAFDLGVKRMRLLDVRSEPDRTERAVARNQKLIDSAEEVPLSLFAAQDKAQARLIELQAERSRLEAEAARIKSRSSVIDRPEELLAAIQSRDGSNDTRLRLRAEIRRRVSRIDVTFGAQIITSTGEPILNLQPGLAKAVIRIAFTNGPTRIVVFQGENKILLS